MESVAAYLLKIDMVLNFFLLVVLLVAATVFDIRSRRIPNKLVILGIVISFVIRTAFYGSPVTWALGLLTGFILFLPLYLIKAMGAGDVKLMAMVGAFVGPTPVANIILATLISGGVLAILLALHRGTLRRALSNTRFALTHSMVKAVQRDNIRLEISPLSAGDLPYAVSITAGTFIYLVLNYTGYTLFK